MSELQKFKDVLGLHLRDVPEDKRGNEDTDALLHAFVSEWVDERGPDAIKALIFDLVLSVGSALRKR